MRIEKAYFGLVITGLLSSAVLGLLSYVGLLSQGHIYAELILLGTLCVALFIPLTALVLSGVLRLIESLRR